jgi:formylglycine-generating enzyme required for sulfatase activity
MTAPLPVRSVRRALFAAWLLLVVFLPAVAFGQPVLQAVEVFVDEPVVKLKGVSREEQDNIAKALAADMAAQIENNPAYLTRTLETLAMQLDVEQRKQLYGCSGSQEQKQICIMEIVGAYGCSERLLGRVMSVGEGKAQVNLKRVRDNTPVLRGTRSAYAARSDLMSLSEVAKRLASSLFGASTSPPPLVPPPPPSSVSFDASSEPLGAQVRLDEVIACEATPCTVRADAGTRTVTMSLLGHQAWSRSVEVSPGMVPMHARLETLEVSLVVTARLPDGEELAGTVEMNGSAVGRTGEALRLGGPGTVSLTVRTERGDGRVECLDVQRAEQVLPVEIVPGMAWIAAGSFLMGSPEGEVYSDPVQRQVALAGFWMDRGEVTVEAYRACVKSDVCAKNKVSGVEWPGSGQEFSESTDCNWTHNERSAHPMNCVDWFQARKYCAWQGKRLPSEAEWEYAARSGGKSWQYPWGDEDPTCDRAVFDDGKKTGGKGKATHGCGEDRTWPVCDASKKAGRSDQGVCDMAGNVEEWTEDCLHWSDDTDGDGRSDAPADGSAWVTSCSVVDLPKIKKYLARVMRGGSWYFTSSRLCAACSSWNAPGTRDYNLGFRCVRSLYGLDEHLMQEGVED